MSRYVKICCIGTRMHNPAATVAETVQAVVASLQLEIEQVLPNHPDVIILPELCDYVNCGKSCKFTYDDFIAGKGETVFNLIRKIAKDNNCNIAFPSDRFIGPKEKINSIRFINRKGEPDGEYIKNFPTINALRSGYKAGKEAQVFSTDYGRVAGALCFDLNFDKLRINYAAQHPDIIIFSSFFHGGLMQQYWAYSCRSFFAGAIMNNATPCSIIAPNGRIIAESTNYTSHATAVVNLDRILIHLDYNRNRFNEIKHKYKSQVVIDDTGRLGSVLLYSHMDGKSAAEIAAEFELEPLDDYFNRAQMEAQKPEYRMI